MMIGEEKLPEITLDHRRQMNAVGPGPRPISRRGQAILDRAKAKGYVAPLRRDLVKP